MSSASDARRRAEIEAKRAKLAELKRAREERSQRLQQRTTSESSTPTTVASASAPGATVSSRKDLDDLVSTLVGGSSSSSRSARGGPSDASPRKSFGPPSSEYGGSEAELAGTTAVTSAPSTAPQPPRELVHVATELFELPQRERVLYTKQVQTTVSWNDHDHEDSDKDNAQATGGVGSEPRDAKLTEDAIRAKILREQADEAASRREEERLEREIQEQLRELTEQERLAIYGANDFSEFVEQSSKIVERALADSYDYMKDYRITDDSLDELSERRQLRVTRVFWDEKTFSNRSITDLDWSSKFPELCVASYNRNEMASDDPDGLVAIWNMHLKDRPEFLFHAQTDVLSCTFSPFHPNLVIGGTYSGQILIWDTRARSLPVLKTPLSAAGHTHPVYSLRMVGTQNAHNLITASTDGTVCSWMLDMLARPQETLQLLNTAHAKTDEVSVTTLGFPDQETTSFWVGTEEGNVYSASRYDRAGAKAGLNTTDVYHAHAAPVTGLDFHPLVGAVDLSDLFLTSSMDWTTKLWRTKTQTPILSFEEANEYVYHVRWHPTHPAVFGQVDGAGRLDVYNLNVDTERPVQSTVVGSGRALNKLAWDRKDGRRCAVGGADGRVYVVDVGDQLVPTEDDYRAMQTTVASLV